MDAEIKSDTGDWSRSFGLRGRLGILAAIFILLTGLALAIIGYRLMLEISASSIKAQVTDTTTIVKNVVTYELRQRVQPLLAALSRGPLLNAKSEEERLKFLPVLASLLTDHLIMNRIFVGYENGDFFTVSQISSEEVRKALNAPRGSVFEVVNIVRGQPGDKSGIIFYDSDLRVTGRGDDALLLNLDPRERIWYKAAMAADDYIETAPDFVNIGGRKAVLFFAQKDDGGRGVVGAAIFLTEVSEILQRELPTAGASLALITPDGTLIAREGGMEVGNGDGEIRLFAIEDLSPVLRLARQAYMDGQRGRDIILNDGTQDWQIAIEEIEFKGKVREVMLLAIPRKDLQAGGLKFLLYVPVGMGIALILCAPLIWLVSRQIARPLDSLAKSAKDVSGLMLKEGASVDTPFSEMQGLAISLRHLQGTIRRILTITQAISSERNFDLLVQRVLEEALPVVKADGGMVVLLDDEKKLVLDKGTACWNINGEKATLPFLYEPHESDTSLVTYQALAQDMIMQTTILRSDPRSLMYHMRPAFADPGVNRVDAVCMPLRDRLGAHIGALLLFKIIRSKADEFSFEEINFIEAFAATVAIAVENERLIKGQTDLRDALVHILAGAIDAKSPYTGGHCQRVPIIFQMLLEAACQETEGAFEKFSLDEDGWEEAKMAAWLHDCGKVTTPEYVVDKATKLETLYDRIHEIRTRFEVLKRDAEIAALRDELAGAEPALARRKLEEEWRLLDDEFAFVASCNIGGEFLDDKTVERLAAIGRRVWVRTLDKSLGVSSHEKARMENGGAPDTPKQESLLMDSPEHIIERSEKDRLDPRNPWGFRLNLPQALYNRGELYNLSIRRGTLTDEERYKINDHITQTIIMLESVPLPGHLRNAPEIAGAHHETMDGKGYPRGLKREEMSWGARMMAVADIFEALTACDRPYKSSKTLRETLKIMTDLYEKNHIDPDVFDLFLRSGIPQKYAAIYLKPEQNDL